MKALQRSWERLSNSMRLFGEAVMRFPSLVEVDREEVITNLDLAFEAKLEMFQTLYDVSKGMPGFKYFDHGEPLRRSYGLPQCRIRRWSRPFRGQA